MCSVFATLAYSKPNIIRQAFSYRSGRNLTGLYSLRLYNLEAEQWQYVIVDDYIPVDNYNRPMFLRSKQT